MEPSWAVRPALLATLAFLGLPLAGCAQAPANLHLYVSNQSSGQPLADIQVTVDGVVLFAEEAPVGDHHNWMLREATLDAGSHLLRATESRSGATASKEFTLAWGAERWVVVDFWDGEGSGDPLLTVEVYDEPVAFA